MKFLSSFLILLVIVGSTLFAKTLTINDHLVHWTPKIIQDLKKVHDIVDAALAHEIELLLVDWQAFRNNLSARKSNQKVFLQMSKKNESVLKRAQASLQDHCHEINRMLDDLHVAQNKVRGKKD